MKEALEASIERLDVVLQVFAVIVAIGVLGEAVFGVRHVLLSRRLRVLQKADETQYQLTIARLQYDVAKADKEAEDERTARVRLESKVAWRRLDLNTQSEVASRLSRFAKQPALLAYSPNDVEASAFASDIAATLHTAKWDISEPLAVLSLREGPAPFGSSRPVPTGVLVWHTDDEGSRKAAIALVEQLSSRGFDAIISPEPRNLLGIHPTPTRVVVSVEHKPEGAQGEYKVRAEKTARR